MLVDIKLVEDTANAVLQPFGWNLTVEGVGAKLSRATHDTGGIDMLDKVYIGRMYVPERYVLWSRKVPYAFLRQQANLLADRLTEWGKRWGEYPITDIASDKDRFDPGPAPSHDPVFPERPPIVTYALQAKLRQMDGVRFVDTTPNRLHEDGTCTVYFGKFYVRLAGKVECLGLIRDGNGHYPSFGFRASASDLVFGTVVRYDGHEIVDILRNGSPRQYIGHFYTPSMGAVTDRLYRHMEYAATADVLLTFDEIAASDRERLGDEAGPAFTDKRVAAVYASPSEDPAELYRVFVDFTE